MTSTLFVEPPFDHSGEIVILPRREPTDDLRMTIESASQTFLCEKFLMGPFPEDGIQPCSDPADGISAHGEATLHQPVKRLADRPDPVACE